MKLILSCVLLLFLVTLGYTKDCSYNKKINSKLICYYSKLTNVDSCYCTHVVLPANTDLKTIDNVRKKLADNGAKILLTVTEFNQGLIEIVEKNNIDGLELKLQKLDSKDDIHEFISTIRDRFGNELYIAVSVPASTEMLAKYYDLKRLTKSADLFVLQTSFLGASRNVTFHPSPLSGLWDMQNTDSVVDLVTGLGAPLSKLVITAPVQAFQFKLQDKRYTTPGSPAIELKSLTRDELCIKMGSDKNWMLERDQDQSGPYIFREDQWIAFEDPMSMDIKAKYARVRGLAGLALKDMSMDGGEKCGGSLLEAAHSGLSKQTRAPRGAVLRSLEREILETPASLLDTVHVSPYRISRVIDVEGHVHTIRKDTRTEFTCTRQGYFVHPKSCGRFYRCVKFDQQTEEYSVFEFDCPAGLAFDSRWEVCVWPGSLPHGTPCSGSSEIAPVPRERFTCPSEPGYYADPENCRWFFACLDHGRSGLTAYEFRCPFGLVYDEKRLLCEWPWLVPSCASGQYGLELGTLEFHGGIAGSSVDTKTIGIGLVGTGEVGVTGYHGDGSGAHIVTGAGAHGIQNNLAHILNTYDGLGSLGSLQLDGYHGNLDEFEKLHGFGISGGYGAADYNQQGSGFHSGSLHLDSGAGSNLHLTSGISNANLHLVDSSAGSLSSGANLHLVDSSAGHISSGGNLHLVDSTSGQLSSGGNLHLVDSTSGGLSSGGNLHLVDSGAGYSGSKSGYSSSSTGAGYSGSNLHLVDSTAHLSTGTQFGAQSAKSSQNQYSGSYGSTQAFGSNLDSSIIGIKSDKSSDQYSGNAGYSQSSGFGTYTGYEGQNLNLDLNKGSSVEYHGNYGLKNSADLSNVQLNIGTYGSSSNVNQGQKVLLDTNRPADARYNTHVYNTNYADLNEKVTLVDSNAQKYGSNIYLTGGYGGYGSNVYKTGGYSTLGGITYVGSKSASSGLYDKYGKFGELLQSYGSYGKVTPVGQIQYAVPQNVYYDGSHAKSSQYITQTHTGYGGFNQFGLKNGSYATQYYSVTPKPTLLTELKYQTPLVQIGKSEFGKQYVDHGKSFQTINFQTKTPVVQQQVFVTPKYEVPIVQQQKVYVSPKIETVTVAPKYQVPVVQQQIHVTPKYEQIHEVPLVNLAPKIETVSVSPAVETYKQGTSYQSFSFDTKTPVVEQKQVYVAPKIETVSVAPVAQVQYHEQKQVYVSPKVETVSIQPVQLQYHEKENYGSYQTFESKPVVQQSQVHISPKLETVSVAPINYGTQGSSYQTVSFETKTPVVQKQQVYVAPKIETVSIAPAVQYHEKQNYNAQYDNKGSSYQSVSFETKPVVQQQVYVAPKIETVSVAPVQYEKQNYGTHGTSFQTVSFETKSQPGVYVAPKVETVSVAPVQYHEKQNYNTQYDSGASYQSVSYETKTPQQVYVAPKPVLQQYVAPKVETVSVAPVQYGNSYQTVSFETKPQVYVAPKVETVTPKYETSYQSVSYETKPVVQQQVYVAPKVETVSVVPSIQTHYYKQQGYEGKYNVKQGKSFQSVSFETKTPIIQEQVYKPVVQEQVYKPVVQEQVYKPVVQEQVYVQKPVVHEQVYVQKPVVHEQVYVAPKVESVTTKYQEYVQPISSTPKYETTYYQTPVKTVTPIVSETYQYVPQKTVLNIKQESREYLPPQKPQTVYVSSTAKTIEYPKKIQTVTAAPVVYETYSLQPQPAVVNLKSTPLKETVYISSTPKPVEIYHEYSQPKYETSFVQTKPVVHQYDKIQLSTPKPVEVYQEYNQAKYVQTKPVVQQYVTPQIQLSTPKPVVYQEYSQAAYVETKPVVQHVAPQIKLSTPKPVVYQEYSQAAYVETKPVVHQYIAPTTPKYNIFQEYIQPKVTQKTYVTPKYEYQEEITIQSTPKPTVYVTSAPQKTVVTPKYEVYQEFSQPQVVYQSTPKPKGFYITSSPQYEQKVLVSSPRPFTKQQYYVSTTPKYDIIQEYVTPKVTPAVISEFKYENNAYKYNQEKKQESVKSGRVDSNFNAFEYYEQPTVEVKPVVQVDYKQENYDYKQDYKQQSYDYKQESYDYKQQDYKQQNYDYQQQQNYDYKQQKNYDYKQEQSYDFKQQENYDYKQQQNYDYNNNHQFKFVQNYKVEQPQQEIYYSTAKPITTEFKYVDNAKKQQVYYSTPKPKITTEFIPLKTYQTDYILSTPKPTLYTTIAPVVKQTARVPTKVVAINKYIVDTPKPVFISTTTPVLKTVEPTSNLEFYDSKYDILLNTPGTLNVEYDTPSTAKPIRKKIKTTTENLDDIDIRFSTQTPVTEKFYKTTAYETYDTDRYVVTTAKPKPTIRPVVVRKKLLKTTAAPIEYFAVTEEEDVAKYEDFDAVHIVSTEKPITLRPVIRKKIVTTAVPITERYIVKSTTQPVVITPKAKGKTIVRVNDFHPFLTTKLGAQCTCTSNTVQLRKKSKQISEPVIDYENLPVTKITSDGPAAYDDYSEPGVYVVGNSDNSYDEFDYESKKVLVTPTPELVISTTNAVQPAPTPVYTIKRKKITPIPSTTAATFVEEVLVRKSGKSKEEKIAETVKEGLTLVKSAIKGYVKEAIQESSRDFDRYGPGGLRSRDEKLQGTVDCQREGLFRHPTQCNKFYACHWDCKKLKYTLHVFNCPVHLTFDSSMGACNWPSKGPACSGNTLLPAV